nr:zeb2-regulated abc transporter 1 [Quercus suber]
MAPSIEPDSSGTAADILATGDIVPAYVSHATPEQLGVCTAILSILFEFTLHKFDDTLDRLAIGKPKFLSVIENFVINGERLEMCLPAFPFKSANKEYKVLGTLPDKVRDSFHPVLAPANFSQAEEIALERLDNICVRIGKIYPPDLLSVSDRDTWAYGEALRAMATRKGLHHIDFSRLRDLVQFPGPRVLNEISYVASATNFRRYLLNQYGKDDIDIEHEIESDNDTMMTYLGYRRFLVSDLQYIFPVSASRTKNGYKRDVKYLAQQMLAFAGAVKASYPNHLRLSIHQSTGEHKISLSLLNTKSDFTTPWHCSVALMADGTWLSAPKGDFERDARFEVVNEADRPSYFQEKVCDPPEASLGEVQVLVEQPAYTSNGYTTARSSFGQIDEKSFADPTQTASSMTSPSAVKEEREESVNPFLATDQPELDPISDRFSARAWLETLMSTAADPDSNPKPVAGIVYKSLSVHAFIEPEAHQRTFDPQRLRGSCQEWRDVGGSWETREVGGISQKNSARLIGFSGCSTFLKTIAGENDGLFTSEDSYLNYQGIPKGMMHKNFKGECIYQAEQDVHFPQLTVGQTADFAARARTYTKHLRDVYMAIFGLTHTVDTMVGNDFVRGVSGGERKRVSLAEVPLQAWDNSTRGLDSATALEFARTLRLTTEVTVTVLYEGRQIYFGNVHAAKHFFVDMGFECPPRQTTADFLTSITNPSERRIRPDFRGKSPSTPDEFAAAWQNSGDRARLMNEIDAFDKRYPLGGPSDEVFKRSRRAVQAKSLRAQSPYTLSLATQVRLCVERGYQRIRGDMGVLISGVLFNSIMALVIGSVFYNLPNETNSLYFRGSLLFFSILLVAFSSSLEVCSLNQAEYMMVAADTPTDLSPLCSTAYSGEAFEIRFLPSFCRSHWWVPSSTKGKGVH